MSDHKTNIDRRKFLNRLGSIIFVTSTPLVSMPLSAEKPVLPKVDEDDPMAKSLGYLHDATKVDVEKYPSRAGDEGAKQFCANCQLYTGKEGSEWGPCAIFPGKSVNAKGWCNVWAKKA